MLTANRLILLLIYLHLSGCDVKKDKGDSISRESSIVELASTVSPEYFTKLLDSVALRINAKGYRLEDFQFLRTDASIRDKIEILSFDVATSGTRRSVTYSLIVWKHKGRWRAYNMSRQINATFTAIHELKENCYLLIGHEHADGTGFSSFAYVVKSDTLFNAGYPAFFGRPILYLHNGDFSYSKNQKRLEYKADPKVAKDNLDALFFSPEYGIYKRDTISARDIKNAIEEEYEKSGSFKMNFDGVRFK